MHRIACIDCDRAGYAVALKGVMSAADIQHDVIAPVIRQ
jgi:hypothetical protein